MSIPGGTEPDGPDPTRADPAWVERSPELLRPAGRTRRWWVLGPAAVLVVVAAGAGFAAGTVVGGGGTQPEDVLPDTVLAYADIDLDPAAEQKVNLIRLLGEFRGVEREYGSEPDLRTLAVDWLVNGSDLEGADVEAWVGDRAGFGLSWDLSTEALTPVAAVQVTDEQEAVADLRRALGPEQVAAVDGYVVVTGDLFEEFDALDCLDGVVGSELPGSQTAAEVVAAGQAAPLAQSEAFTSVFDRLDDGVLTTYLDGERLATAGEEVAGSLGVFGPAIGDSLVGVAESGRAGAVLRAEPNALEVLAWTSVAPQGDGQAASLMTTLPASTLLALEFTGGSELVADRWEMALADISGQGSSANEIERELAKIEAQYGVRLPADLETLVGDDVVIAVEGAGLLTGIPGIGLRSVTDPASGAELASRIEDRLASLTGGFGVTADGTDDGLVVASTDDYANQLASGDGKLGADPTFTEALPDAGAATNLVWVDFSGVKGFATLAAPESAGLIEPLDAFGLTVTPDAGGSLTRARLVFDAGKSS